MALISTDLTMPKTNWTEPVVPSFRQYRTKDHACMVPDKGFVKQLKHLDKEFEVVWDWGSNKWEIWKFPRDKDPYHVTTVQTKEKTYRQLGADILLKLQEGQVWDKYSLDEVCNYLEELDNQVRRRRAKDFQNKIEAITNETFNYVRGVMQVQVPRSMAIQRTVENASD